MHSEGPRSVAEGVRSASHVAPSAVKEAGKRVRLAVVNQGRSDVACHVATTAYFLALTVIIFGLASSALGRRRTSTPFSIVASALPGSSGVGSVTLRLNCP